MTSFCTKYSKNNVQSVALKIHSIWRETHFLLGSFFSGSDVTMLLMKKNHLFGKTKRDKGFNANY